MLEEENKKLITTRESGKKEEDLYDIEQEVKKV